MSLEKEFKDFTVGMELVLLDWVLHICDYINLIDCLLSQTRQ